MFISKLEKSRIEERLKLLEQQVRDLTIKVITVGNFPEARKERSTLGWTEEARARHSARLKKSWQDRKSRAAA